MTPVRGEEIAHIQLRDDRLLAAIQGTGEAFISDDLIFPAKDGGRLTADTIGRNYMEPALTRAGLRKFTLHQLRHTFASLHIQNGTPLKYVSEWLGHSSIQITADLYGHLDPGAHVDLIDSLDTPANRAQTPPRAEKQELPQVPDFATAYLTSEPQRELTTP